MTGPPPLRALVLDVGNVLVTWEPQAALAGRLSTSQWQEFRTGAAFDALNARADSGEDPAALVAEIAATYPQRPDWARTLACYWKHFEDSLTGPVPGMGLLMADLARAEVPVYALTNFNDQMFARTRHLLPGKQTIRGVVVSGEEGCRKPDARIYRILVKRFRLQPERTLFVDDSEANLVGARNQGFRTHLFTGAGALRATLCDAGLLPPRP